MGRQYSSTSRSRIPRVSKTEGSLKKNISGVNGGTNGDGEKIEFAGDPWHNNEIPFCRLLVDLAQEIIPVQVSEDDYTATKSKAVTREASTSENNVRSIKGFALLIREYLAADRRRQKLLNTTTTTTNKKKRRNRKKKKSIQQQSQDPNAEFPEDGTCSTSTSTGRLSNEMGDEHQQLDDSKLTGNLDGRVFGGDTSDESSRTKMFERFLDEKITSLVEATQQQTGASDDNCRNSLQDFLEAVIEQQKSLSGEQTSISITVKNGKKASASQNNYHVSYAQVHAAFTAIACPTCRGSVRKVLSSEFCLPVNPETFSKDVIDQEEKAAFDYVAMEEGIGGNGIPSAHPKQEIVFQLVTVKNNKYENADQLEGSSGYHLRRTIISDESNTKTSTWTMEDVELMIKQYVIMSGFTPDVISGAKPISEDVVLTISDKVDIQTSKVSKIFRDIAKELENKVEAFAQQQLSDKKQAAIDPESVDIDMRTFPVIKETDMLCCNIIERLLEVSWDITRTVQRIIAHNASGANQTVSSSCSWAVGPCKYIWETFWRGVSSCAEQIESFEQQLFQMCDRLGNIPPMYLNSQSRAVYRGLVESKIRIVHGMILSIERILNHQTSVDGLGCEGWSTSFVRKAFTVDEFYREVLPRSDVQLYLSCVDEKVEKSCKQVIEHVNSTLSKTLLLQNAKQVIDTHAAELDDLIVLLQKLQSSLLPSHTIHKSVDILSQNVIGFKSEGTQTRSGFCKLMEQFAYNLILHAADRPECSKVDSALLVLPLKLRQSMVLTQRKQKGTALVAGYNLCDGSNGKLRAVGMLVGLFLNGWLLDRYKEWQARVAEHELLTTIDGEVENHSSIMHIPITEDNSINPKSTQISKKTKKKKSKKVNDNDADDVLDLVDKSNDDSNQCSDRTSRQPLATNSGDQSATSVEDETLSVEAPSLVQGTIYTQELSLKYGSQQKIQFNSTLFSQDTNERSQTQAAESDNAESKFTSTLPCNRSTSSGSGATEIDLSKQDQQFENNSDIKPVNNFDWTNVIANDVESQVNVLVHSSNGFQSAEKFLLDRLLALYETSPTQ